MPREDALWLKFSHEEASCSVQTSKLRSLIRSLQAAHGQTPSLVLFFESPEHRYFPPHEDSGVYLRLDLETLNDSSPLFLASTQSMDTQSASWHTSRFSKHIGSTNGEAKYFPRTESITCLAQSNPPLF